jgi:mannose-1-phosphate guanylyltransferase/mannose-6-phosphate isomerase
LPLSRKQHPKQFLKLNGEISLLKQTIDRLLGKIALKDLIIVTNRDYEYHIQSEHPELRHIILEPIGRNTAPAIALAIKYCLEKLGLSEDEVIFVGASDHVIKLPKRFIKYLDIAERAAEKGHIVTFGIKPLSPETGYGYIRTGKRLSKKDRVYEVKRFVEKPNLGRARRYVKSGKYFWNSGMFAFTIKTMIEEFEKYCPEIYKVLNKEYDNIINNFHKLPEISIDYAVAEK